MGKTRLSLCVIAGNEEAIIRRCLDIFARGIPVDELIVVRAVGATSPDKTLDIARDEYGAITGEYFNSPQYSDWPHVDNFAAARQQGWDKATGDVLMWVDCDDTAVPHSLKRIRELADHMPADIVVMPYSISGQPVAPMRERLFKRGFGTWENAVHESCRRVLGSTHHFITDAAILHTPVENKHGSNERNLRILDTITNKNCVEKFFYHMELLGAKRFKEAVDAAKACVVDEELADVNKYEVWLNLNGLADSFEKKAKLLQKAIELCPKRREAIGRMAVDAMNHGHFPEALHFARMMMALPEPEVKSAFHRAAIYGWAGQMFLAHALRLNGHMQEAADVDRQRCPRPRFSILHATRARPQRAAEINKFFHDRAHDPSSIEYLFAVDADDKESLATLARFALVVVPPGGGVVKAINAAAMKARGTILVMAADDCLPPPRWDYDVWEKFESVGNMPRVLAVSDGWRKDMLITHPIMNRAFYRQQGYFFAPAYPHLFCDTELSHRAVKAGQIIDGRELLFRHNNPLFTGETPDALALERNSPDSYKAGFEIFKRRNPDVVTK